MADPIKVSALDAITGTLAGTDKLMVVETPGGTPKLVLVEVDDLFASAAETTTGTETLKAVTPKALKDAGISAGREMLTGNRTYYVRTDGNDSNTGLENTSGGAFLTIQKAIDVAATLDCSTYNITIQVADGTYVANTITLKNIIGPGSVTIQGNTTTPANCVIDGGFYKDTTGTTYDLAGFKFIKSSGSATTAIISYYGSRITFRSIEFSTGFTYHMDSQLNGVITAGGNYTISGGCSIHSRCLAGGKQLINGRTITVSGTPAITIYAYAESLALSYHSGNTYSGSATGKRYEVNTNAIINTGGGGATYFPGSTAGTAVTGGLYV